MFVSVMFIFPHLVLCHSSRAVRRFDFHRVHHILGSLVRRRGRITSPTPTYHTVTSLRPEVEIRTIIRRRLAGSPFPISRRLIPGRKDRRSKGPECCLKKNVLIKFESFFLSIDELTGAMNVSSIDFSDSLSFVVCTCS